jgi:hypothetical protein
MVSPYFSLPSYRVNLCLTPGSKPILFEPILGGKPPPLGLFAAVNLCLWSCLQGKPVPFALLEISTWFYPGLCQKSVPEIYGVCTPMPLYATGHFGKNSGFKRPEAHKFGINRPKTLLGHFFPDPSSRDTMGHVTLATQSYILSGFFG